jgi:hypothetical protein
MAPLLCFYLSYSDRLDVPQIASAENPFAERPSAFLL